MVTQNARSCILDTDYVQEGSAMPKALVMQQTGSSLLGQVN
ncbi:flagellin [Pectobacterium versatile]